MRHHNGLALTFQCCHYLFFVVTKCFTQEMGILAIFRERSEASLLATRDDQRLSVFIPVFLWPCFRVEEEESFLLGNPFGDHGLSIPPICVVVPINLIPVTPLLSKAPRWALSSLDNHPSVAAKCLIIFLRRGIEHRTIIQEQLAETYEHV